MGTSLARGASIIATLSGSVSFCLLWPLVVAARIIANIMVDGGECSARKSVIWPG